MQKKLELIMGEGTEKNDTRQQVRQTYTVPSDPGALANAFSRFLEVIPGDCRLILFIDALDQLDPGYSAHGLFWLPRELPQNVRVVVSLLANDDPPKEDPSGQAHRSARSRFAPDCFLHLRPMTPSEGRQLLDAWLEAAGRGLRDDQHQHLAERFDDCPLPLYLKIAFEEARRWRSYDPGPSASGKGGALGRNMSELIRQFFGRLSDERAHGAALVSRFLGLLTAARRGLTEDEILDLLSEDAEVMSDLGRRSPDSPKIDRLPVVVWSRLRFDLEPYLSERSADRTRVLAFYHRQFEQVARDQYLSGADAQRTHRQLAGYFSRQPHNIDSEGAVPTPNYRKASEWTYHIARVADWQVMTAALTDVGHLQAKCAAGMIEDLMADFALAIAEADVERALLLRQWRDVLRREAELIRHHASAIPQIVYQQAYNAPYHPDVARAAKAVDEAGQAPAHPWFQIYEMEPGALTRPTTYCHRRRVAYMPQPGYQDATTLAALGSDAFASGHTDGTLVIWDLETGLRRHVVQAHKWTVMDMLPIGPRRLATDQPAGALA
jgi:hypothetical protein